MFQNLSNISPEIRRAKSNTPLIKRERYIIRAKERTSQYRFEVHIPSRSIADFSKRCIEFVLASSLLILLSPIMIWISFKIYSERAGSIFFRQERVGKHGKTFQIFKFRSMHTNAESKGPFICTTYHDPRITKFGTFLRKSKLDELPQLLNIIRGEMSFVGPRPEQPFFHRKFRAIQNWERRLEVKPGITGPAQLSRTIGHEPKEKIIADLQYIEQRSFFLDLKLMFLTLLTIFGKYPLQ